jgi:hypothetical protein
MSRRFNRETSVAIIFSARPKSRLAPNHPLSEVEQLHSITMKKYICILASAALLAACEQKTETVTPTASPNASDTTTTTTTATASPADATTSPTP